MILKFLVFLLTVQTAISAKLMVQTSSTNRTIIDTKYLSSNDTLHYEFFSTPIYSGKGISFIQPVIAMVPSCPVIINNIYDDGKTNSIELKVTVDEDPLKTSGQNFPGRIQGVKGNFILHPQHHGNLEDRNRNKFPFYFSFPLNGSYNLYINCGSSENCYKMWAVMNSNLSEVSSLSLDISSVAMRTEKHLQTLTFLGVHIETPIQMDCSWTVVQIIDNSKPDSDPKLWNNHQQGFGDLDTNYWIGLDMMHLITDRKGRPNYKCKLRIVLEDWKAKRYFGQWNQFQVMGTEDNYRLRVGEEAEGTLINGLAQYKYMKFNFADNETDECFNYKKYNDYIAYYQNYLSRNSTNRSCSTSIVNIGWWFNSCFSVNINGDYYKTSDTQGDAKLNTVGLKAGSNFNWVPMKKSLMTVNCE